MKLVSAVLSVFSQIVMEGGFDCNYENPIGATGINGTFWVNSGMVTAAGVFVK